jgi:hypothetical protein
MRATRGLSGDPVQQPDLPGGGVEAGGGGADAVCEGLAEGTGGEDAKSFPLQSRLKLWLLLQGLALLFKGN